MYLAYLDLMSGKNTMADSQIHLDMNNSAIVCYGDAPVPGLSAMRHESFVQVIGVTSLTGNL